MAKIAITLWTTGLIIFSIPLSPTIANTPITFAISLIIEFLVGVAIGFTADLLVTGIELGGTLMDTQAGLSVASILDPTTGRNSALFETFLKRVAILLFLIIDGHHMVLAAINKSYYLLPVGAPINFIQGARYLLTFGTDIFKTAIHLSAPILLVIFLVDFAFGMLNKVAEQINVFQLGFQIKPTVALIVFLAITPGIINSIITLMENAMSHLITLLSLFQVVN